MADEDLEQDQELETDDLDTGLDRELNAPSAPSLRDGFRNYGYDIPDDVDDKSLIEQISGMARRLQGLPSEGELAELRQYADLGRKHLQTQGDSAPEQQGQPVQKQAPAPKKWSAPELPAGWRNDVEIDFATGQVKAKNPNYPNVSAMEAARKYLDFRTQTEDRLYSNPVEFLKEAGLSDELAALKQELRDEILKEFQGQQTQQHDEQYVQSFLSEHQADFFEIAKDGQPVKDFFTGQPRLSDKGKAFYAAVQQGQAYGIQGNRALTQFAWDQVQAQFPANKKRKSVQDEELEPEDESPTQLFVRNGKDAHQRQVNTRMQNRDATVQKAVRNRQEKQNEHLDFKQMAKSALNRAGIG